MKWVLIVVGCVAAIQVASNWKKCTGEHYNIGPDGKSVAYHTGVPSLACLLLPSSM